MIDPNDAYVDNIPQLVNEAEFFRTAANISNANLVYLSDGYAVPGPAETPPDLDFQATSFGSQTSCRVLTGLCAAQSTVGNDSDLSDFNFICNATVAGLNMTGNFMNLIAPMDDDRPPVTNATQGNRTDPHQVVLGGNTILGNSFSLGFQYFDDSQRLAQTYANEYYGSGEDRHQLYWALVWRAPTTTVLTHLDTPITNETAAVGLSDEWGGGSVGILSCETNISEVVRCSRTNSRNSFGNVSTDLLLQQRHHGYRLLACPKDECIYPLCRRRHRP